MYKIETYNLLMFHSIQFLKKNCKLSVNKAEKAKSHFMSHQGQTTTEHKAKVKTSTTQARQTW